LFLLSWGLQTWTGWRKFEAEQAENQQSAEVFGADGYFWDWAQATFENWQSEFLQLLAMVVFTSFLIYKGSAESRDTDDETLERLDRIERLLDELAPNPLPGERAPRE
jgi:hypothetical protein